MARSKLLIGSSLLASLVLNACAVPADKCTKENNGVFETDLCVGDDTGVIDSGETGDSAPDTDSAETGDSGDDTAVPIDADNDGFNAEDDCNDGDAAVNPDATEICDGVDNDCDGTTDVGAADESTFYADTDGDGYGNAAVTETACSASVGFVADATDCDDADAAIHPSAEETDCGGTVDYNCDGSVGSDDRDADGWLACEDCDDSEAAANPSGTEVCDGLDNDCEGTVDVSATDETTWYADGDSDSYGDPDSSISSCDEPTGYVADSTDCDDTAATVHPGGTEVCDELNVDENCDGTAEADDSIGATQWKADDDGDGFGDPSVTVSQCDAPPGYVTTASGDEDCDDSDPAVNVDATEACNGYDDDCDGDVDESGSTGETTWFADSDEDGYGDPSTTQLACTQPSKYSEDSSDCDDTDSGTNPGEVDIAGDGIDQDCDGADALETDSDGDGDPDSTDCDDANPGVYTGADEYCDGVDEDCDGVSDDGALDILTWYRDADNDGYGYVAVTVSACDEPSGYTANSTDCDDTSNDSYPGNIEWCDGADNDCSGTADDGDYDADGYEVCDDCDDGDAGLNPGEPEACDGEDNDCDGVVDDGVTTEFFLDSDGDGFGDPDVWEDACSASSGYVSDDTDCDDDRDYVSPAESQECYSGLDEDCDGDVAFDDSDCGAASTDNLFTTSGSWNGETDPGTASIGSWLRVSGAAVSTNCTSANTDSCSLSLAGPGSWTVTSDTAATVGSMYCMFSATSDASSTNISYSFGSSGIQSYDASNIGWGHAVLGPFSQTSSGTITFSVTVSETETVLIDSVACQQ